MARSLDKIFVADNIFTPAEDRVLILTLFTSVKNFYILKGLSHEIA